MSEFVSAVLGFLFALVLTALVLVLVLYPAPAGFVTTGLGPLRVFLFLPIALVAFTIACYVAAAAWTLLPQASGLWSLFVSLAPVAVTIRLVGGFWPLPSLTAIQAVELVYVATFVVFALALPHFVVTLVMYVFGAITSILGTDWSGLELFSRGFMVGSNAAFNLLVGIVVYPLGLNAAIGPPGLIVGIVLAVALTCVTFLTVLAPTSPVAKGIVGWLAFLQPASWGTLCVGAVLHWMDHTIAFFLGWLGGPTVTLDRTWLDVTTGGIVTFGGFWGNVNPADTGFNMGTYCFVDSNQGVPLSGSPGPLTFWIVNHEVGHHLNLAAFGAAFHWIGAIEQMVEGWITGVTNVAYSERLAESHVPAGLSGARPTVPMWL